MDRSTDAEGPTDPYGTRADRQDRVTELERQLDRQGARIQELERQLSEARDLEALAERLYRAILDQDSDDGATESQRQIDDAASTDEATGEPTNEGEPDEILLDRLDEDTDTASSDDEPVMTAADALGGDGFTMDPEPAAPAGGSDLSRAQPDGADAETATDLPGRSGEESERPADDAFDEATTEPERPADEATEAASDGTDGPTADGAVAWGGDGESADHAIVERLRAEIESLSVVEREMLRHYRTHGPTTPPAAHQAVGGSGDRTTAYAANRALRTRGLVEHAVRGRHRYAVPALIADAMADPLSADAGPAAPDRDRLVQAVEASFVHDVQHPATEPDLDAATGPAFGDDVGAWPDA